MRLFRRRRDAMEIGRAELPTESKGPITGLEGGGIPGPHHIGN
jgi:hypothetical protein